MQRPPRKVSNKWIMEAIVAGGRSENLGQVRFGPAFEVAIEQQVPGCSVIGKPIKNLHYSPPSIGDVDHMDMQPTKARERTGKFDMTRPRDRNLSIRCRAWGLRPKLRSGPFTRRQRKNRPPAVRGELPRVSLFEMDRCGRPSERQDAPVCRMRPIRRLQRGSKPQQWRLNRSFASHAAAHRAPVVDTGCIRVLATCSPILRPMSWPTRTENR